MSRSESPRTQKEVLTLRCPEDILSRLDELAARLDCSRSALVQAALEMFLANEQSGQADFLPVCDQPDILERLRYGSLPQEEEKSPENDYFKL